MDVLSRLANSVSVRPWEVSTLGAIGWQLARRRRRVTARVPLARRERQPPILATEPSGWQRIHTPVLIRACSGGLQPP